MTDVNDGVVIDDDVIDVDFDAHNVPAVVEESFSSLDESLEEDFVRRYEDLKSILTEPFAPLSDRGSRILGETVTFSEENIIGCNGRFVFGPQVWQLSFSFVLQSAFAIAASAAFQESLPVWMHVMTWVLWLAMSVAMLKTGSCDPGVVPKRMIPIEPPPQRMRVSVNNADVTVRYCTTCDTFRGPRTHHCGVCGNCVDQFDHHCPWIGTCIGAKNYHFFILYLHTLHLFALMVIADCIVAPIDNSIRHNIGIVSALNNLHWIPIVLISLVLLLGVSITGLMFLHWYLMSKNLTTAEFLKCTFDEGDTNPWDLGWMQNLRAKILGAVDPQIHSWNYQCFVVRELVRREIELLSQEREEELRVRRRHST